MELPAGLAPASDEVAARRLSVSDHGSRRNGGSERSRTSGTVVRRFSKPLCKTDMHVASVRPPEAIRTPEPGFVVLAAVHLPGGCCVACGIRTHVSALRGQRPRPTRRTRHR